jgi:hypothetical protein
MLPQKTICLVYVFFFVATALFVGIYALLNLYIIIDIQQFNKSGVLMGTGAPTNLFIWQTTINV